MAYHVGDPLPHDPPEQFLMSRVDRIGGRGQVGHDARRAQQFPAAGEFAGESHLAVARHRGPHVGERLAGQALDGGDFLDRAR